MNEEEEVKSELNEKQEQFCNEYIIDLNLTQAAIRAGYSKDTAAQQASRLFKHVKIRQRIDELKKERGERNKIDQDWVLNRFKEISDRCLQVEPVLVHDGNKWVESGEYKFDASGANKATEMLAKHIGFFEEHNNQKQPVTEIIIKKQIIGGKRD